MVQSARRSKAVGLFLGSSRAIRFSHGMSSSLHTQHATTVLLALEDTLTVQNAGGEVTGPAVLVPANLAHAVRCTAPAIALLVDPVALAAPVRAATVLLADRLRAVVRATADPERIDRLPDVADALLEDGRLGLVARRLDRRIARALDAGPPLVPPPGLSLTHFRDLFARDVGISPRRFMLWRRLIGALASARPGELTAAALRAGFADHAHFTRTCRALLGYPPSALG